MFKFVRTPCAFTLCAVGALAVVSAASAHAHVNPAVVLAKAGQEFALTVPTEKENATTAGVEFTPPAGFSIDSFAATPGWKREVQSTGTGEDTVIQKITWTGGNVPHEEYAVFRFLASTDASKTYSFSVRQTYSDGSVVDWSGPESSDTPAPTIESVSSLGGSSTSTWAIVALIAAIVALLVAFAGLAAKGRRAVA
jgi:uncharacterized protein YcnI